MDIKAGEYVRTEQGIIGKIKNNFMESERMSLDNEKVICSRYIINHSLDIKELIEEGDIVEYSINNMMTPKIARVRKYKEARSFKEYLGIEGYKLDQIVIIRVLTKEQFKTESYEV